MRNPKVTLWTETRTWCRIHPEKNAAIVTPEGTYIIRFVPRKEEKQEFVGEDYEGIKKHFIDPVKEDA